MRKKIGISFTKSHFHNYWNWLLPQQPDDDWELVELSFEKNNGEDIQNCDAFVLTGGVDVHPSFYKGSDQYQHRPDVYQPVRDEFEQKIFTSAMDRQVPLLGICRGLQLANVLLGGTLVQDLGGGNETHRKIRDDKIHDVEVKAGSLLHGIVLAEKGTVNSAHHQAIETLGSNLRVNALSSDGVIEGIEYDDPLGKAFFLGVQWHPERMVDKEQNFFSSQIKKRFLQAVRDHQS